MAAAAPKHYFANFTFDMTKIIQVSAASRRMFHKSVDRYRDFVEEGLDVHVKAAVPRVQTRLLASKNGNPALDFYVTVMVAIVRSHQVSWNLKFPK